MHMIVHELLPLITLRCCSIVEDEFSIGPNEEVQPAGMLHSHAYAKQHQTVEYTEE